jgi:hypothetical protein
MEYYWRLLGFTGIGQDLVFRNISLWRTLFQSPRPGRGT